VVYVIHPCACSSANGPIPLVGLTGDPSLPAGSEPGSPVATSQASVDTVSITVTDRSVAEIFPRMSKVSIALVLLENLVGARCRGVRRAGSVSSFPHDFRNEATYRHAGSAVGWRNRSWSETIRTPGTELLNRELIGAGAFRRCIRSGVCREGG